jgi:hypothetical protein
MKTVAALSLGQAFGSDKSPCAWAFIGGRVKALKTSKAWAADVRKEMLGDWGLPQKNRVMSTRTDPFLLKSGTLVLTSIPFGPSRHGCL